MGWSRFRKKRDMPEGLWVKCPSCSETLYNKDLATSFNVCSACGHHLKMTAQERIDMLLDPRSFRELWHDLEPLDRLEFTDRVPYPEKLKTSRERSQATEAARAGTGTIKGQPVSVCVLDFGFMGGSMGTVVGEKVTRAVELATREQIPVIIISCSGGARMHEGVLSLMQMAKTSAALARHHEAGGLFISLLADPTTGGVMASFAALGDIIIAEPRALIGFAGPRVIRETLRTELPEGFQTSEFLLAKGFIDRIEPRAELRKVLALIIGCLVNFTDDQRERFAAPPAAEDEQEEQVEAEDAAEGAEDDAPEGAVQNPPDLKPEEVAPHPENSVADSCERDPALAPAQEEPEAGKGDPSTRLRGPEPSSASAPPQEAPASEG